MFYPLNYEAVSRYYSTAQKPVKREQWHGQDRMCSCSILTKTTARLIREANQLTIYRLIISPSNPSADSIIASLSVGCA